MKIQTKLKWIRGIKLFLVIICALGVVKMLNDYDEINDSFVQQQHNYELLKSVHEQTLNTYKIDLSNNELLEMLSDRVVYQETMIKGLAPNNKLASYYFYILTLGVWIMVYIIQYLNKKEDELQGFPVDLDDDE